MVGFLAAESNAYLFLSKDHAAFNDLSSAVLVILEDEPPEFSRIKDCNNRAVRLIGKFGEVHEGEYGFLEVSEINVIDDSVRNFGLGRSCYISTE